jgi:hypothetical protein
VVGQRLVEGVPQIPAVGQVETRGLDQLTFGTNPLEEHDQLQLAVDDRVDARPTPLGVQLSCPVTDERQVELGFQVAVEVVRGNERFQRDGNEFVEAARLGGTEHPVGSKTRGPVSCR